MTWQRILTGAVLIPIVVALVWYAPPALFAAAVALVIALALWEFFQLGDAAGLRAFRPWTLFGVALLAYSQWSAGQIESHALAGGAELLRHPDFSLLEPATSLLIFIYGLAMLTLSSNAPLSESLPRVAASLSALLLVALPASFLICLREAPRLGSQWVLFLLVLVWVGDTAALIAGKSFGRTKLAPLISPKKTWEGAAGNLLASTLVAIPFSHWMNVDLAPLAALAVVASLAGQIGDLFESACKRGAGVKDSGTILPGHGGMLDRIDSLILATPVVWCYVVWWGTRS
jgi:phosphatidate cytidylyltransferase